MSTESTATRVQEEINLDFFVGHWRNTGKVHPGPFGPGGDSTGETTYSWELDNSWLMYDSVLHLPGLGKYQVCGGVHFDRQSGRYRAFAYNNLGVHLTYDGYWRDETHLVFDLIHPKPPGASRVVYIKQADGTIQMNSEISDDGVTFSPYFETTLSSA